MDRRGRRGRSKKTNTVKDQNEIGLESMKENQNSKSGMINNNLEFPNNDKFEKALQFISNTKEASEPTPIARRTRRKRK